MHWIYSTRQNRIVIAIATLKHAHWVTNELHLAEDTFNGSTGCLDKCNKTSSNCKVVNAGGRMICLRPFLNPP